MKNNYKTLCKGVLGKINLGWKVKKSLWGSIIETENWRLGKNFTRETESVWETSLKTVCLEKDPKTQKNFCGLKKKNLKDHVAGV